MSDQETQPGFRFGTLMGWAPAFIAVIGFTIAVMGYHLAGGLLVVAALIFWIIVRRRKSPSVGPGGQS